MEHLELQLTGFANGGEAVGRDDEGRVVFVAGGLPGERVAAVVTDTRKRFLRARVVDVVEASSDRVEPPCPHVADGCGGCDLQHVASEAERELKRTVVMEALERIGRLTAPDVRLASPLPVLGYRTTVRVAVDQGRVGFRRRGSHAMVPVDRCLIAHPLVDELVVDGDPGSATELVLRAGARTGERLVLASPTAEGVEMPAGVRVVGADELAAGSRAWYHEEVAGRTWRISAESFFQARPDGAEQLIDEVHRTLADAPSGRLVDLFGGVGLFAGTVAGERPVELVERSSAAAADARMNLSESDVRVVRVAAERWRPSKATVVVADPARRGLGAVGADVVAATDAARVVLVSCEASSLARDTALLAERGYRHGGSTLVDMFPRTSEIEVVTRFDRVDGRSS